MYKLPNKTFNIILAGLLAFCIIFVVITNLLIDPLDVFHLKNRFNIIKPCITKNQRLSVIPSLKLNKENIDAVWIGTSRTGWSENEMYDSKVSGEKFLNLTINAATFNESLNMAYNAVLIHPEIKEIYFGADFLFFNKVYSKSDETVKKEISPKINRQEILPLLLSGNVFIYSFNTVLKNIKTQAALSEDEIIKAYGSEHQYNDEIDKMFNKNIKSYYDEAYKNYELDDQKFKQLKDFVSYANEKGVKVVIFATSMHVTERILIDKTNNLEDFYLFKKELANIQPYYDFAIIDKYTLDEIKPDMQYFRDMIHPYPYLRKKISDQLFFNNEDFGILVTKDNADKIIKNDKLKFKNYVKDNKDLVKRVEEQIK